MVHYLRKFFSSLLIKYILRPLVLISSLRLTYGSLLPSIFSHVKWTLNDKFTHIEGEQCLDLSYFTTLYSKRELLYPVVFEYSCFHVLG